MLVVDIYRGMFFNHKYCIERCWSSMFNFRLVNIKDFSSFFYISCGSGKYMSKRRMVSGKMEGFYTTFRIIFMNYVLRGGRGGDIRF